MEIKGRSLLSAFIIVMAGLAASDVLAVFLRHSAMKAASAPLALQSVSVAKLTSDTADDFQPIWSPDGSTIAFLSNRRQGS